MIRLAAKDASILARIAQYGEHYAEKTRVLLGDASPEAQRIGRALLGENVSDLNPEEIKFIEQLEVWAKGNRDYVSNRRAGVVRAVATD